MKTLRRVWPAAALLLAGCVAPSKPPPPRVATVPAPQPPPAVVPPAPAETDWRDVPLTPGAWRYSGEGATTRAAYGPAAAPVFEMRCDVARHELRLVRPGAAGSLTVRTSYGTNTFPPRIGGDGTAGIVLTARDPALDRIAFSRGRFSVASEGQPILFLPAWAEPSRVIEDCR